MFQTKKRYRWTSVQDTKQANIADDIKGLLKTGITPNQISVLSCVIGLAGASLFFFGEYFYLILGGIIVHIHSIVDGCDGEIARLKLRRTRYGGWLDSFLVRYVDAVILLGLTYGYWSISGDSMI